MRAAAFFEHQETQNTYGGTCTAGSWEDRKITNITSDLNSLISLAPLTGIITIQPGTYVFNARTPFYAVSRGQSRLVNAVSGAVLITGSDAYSLNGNGVQVDSVISGILTVTQAITVKIQSKVEITIANVGYGIAANFGTEIYTTGNISVLG